MQSRDRARPTAAAAAAVPRRFGRGSPPPSTHLAAAAAATLLAAAAATRRPVPRVRRGRTLSMQVTYSKRAPAVTACGWVTVAAAAAFSSYSSADSPVYYTYKYIHYSPPATVVDVHYDPLPNRH